MSQHDENKSTPAANTPKSFKRKKVIPSDRIINDVLEFVPKNDPPIKRKLKKVVPVSRSYAAFQGQVMAGFIHDQTKEILKLIQIMENNNEARFSAMQQKQNDQLSQFKEAIAQIEVHIAQQDKKQEALQRSQEKLEQKLDKSIEAAKITNQLLSAVQKSQYEASQKIGQSILSAEKVNQLLIGVQKSQAELIQKLNQSIGSAEKANQLIKKQVDEVALGLKAQSQTLSSHASLSFYLQNARQDNAPESSYMVFNNFTLRDNGFSCLVRSSKRETADLIDFTLSKDVGQLHPDIIAGTLATLCGRTYRDIYFDMPLSQQAESKLSAFTKAKWHVPETTQPYQPNLREDKIMLNFSGGFDSLAAKALLPENVDLIAVDFGGWFERETEFFKTFSPNILTTNFRKLKYDREDWTFMGTGAMLFANALNAKYNVFGTIFEANADQTVDNPRVAQNLDTMPFSMLGLKDIRLTNGLTEVATVMIVTRFYPEYVQASLKSLAAVGSEKLYRKQVLTDIIRTRFNRDIEPISFNLPDTEKWAVPFGRNFALDFLAIYELKYAGEEVVRRTVLDIPEEAYELASRLSLRFYERLNTKFLHTVPENMREMYLERLKAADVECYDENDWIELNEVRTFLSRYHKVLLK